ncbi:DUF1254 domain-containing protein [Algoriphagus kandeliae]|uniref:DUF1254 domain-containing protein n=1 Tax=Algoriphagus kandeliae TaxID=2562278 RepID=A0A4Y9QXT3_9BACT|nr:DUF1254 domain-containing protein [Algoriphagus kandeliae]TFV96026.1 DUF1254 domain-containing protein [Algoriphagus kandeliae]
MKKLLALIFISSIIFVSTRCAEKEQNINLEEAQQIAEEAYIFAYPMLEHYKMMFAMAMYPESGAYTAPFNVLYHKPELSTAKDTIIVRPNNDNIYSSVWFDLSEQPQILKVPKIEDNRYYSFQIIDLYTHNIGYVGTRATGFEEGSYLFAGPNWDGEVPDGINKVFRSEGNYLLALGRTQVFGPDDLETTNKILEGFSVESLNVFIGLSEIAKIPDNPNIPPFNPNQIKNINFISYLNALMATASIHPFEKELFDRFSKIGIGPGKTFNETGLDPELKAVIETGIANAMKKIEAEVSNLGERQNGWMLISGAFGNREFMQGKYLRRAAAAYFGLWGNNLEEAYYPEATVDADGEDLDGSKHNYTVHFEADRLPPVKAFWSFTMYKLPEQLLVANEIDRYIIASNTKGLKYNPDGSLDIYIQKENPGPDLESNWLPAHDGPFSLQARFYWPEPESLDPLYVPPVVQKN